MHVIKNVFDIFHCQVGIWESLLKYVIKFVEAPLLLAFILGPRMEIAFRRSLIISDGSLAIFVTRPICAVSLIIAILLYATISVGFIRKGRETIVANASE